MNSVPKWIAVAICIVSFVLAFAVAALSVSVFYDDSLTLVISNPNTEVISEGQSSGVVLKPNKSYVVKSRNSGSSIMHTERNEGGR